MTLTTTQLAGMSDEQLIEMAGTDFERELAERFDLMLATYTPKNCELSYQELEAERARLGELTDELVDELNKLQDKFDKLETELAYARCDLADLRP